MKKYIVSSAALIVLMIAALPSIVKAQDEKIFYQRPSYWRPYDKRGVNLFETSKQEDSIKFEGLRVRLGAGFTQSYQALKHSNTANDKESTNKLYALTP